MAQDEEPADPGISPVAEESKRKKEAERTQHTSLPRGGGDKQDEEHRPTLPTGQPNDRLFADGPRKKEGKEIAHRSEKASATNYADLCPHCPLSLSGWRGPKRAGAGQSGPPKPCATVNDSMEEAALRCCSPTLWVGVREVCSKNGERATTNDREDDRVVDENEEDDNEGPS